LLPSRRTTTFQGMLAFPPAPFRGMLLRRAAVLWLLGRLCILMFGAGTREFADVIRLTLPASALLIGLVTGLSMLDARRRHELVLLANLGIARRWIVMTALLPPALLEAATRVFA